MDVVRTTDSGRAAAHTMLAGPAAREVSARHPRRVFFGLCALLFVVSAALTVVVCMPMSAGSGMPMPGGWSMSMAWSRMSGQSWLHVGASFTGMWALMMVAMMMPSITPVLWRCHESLGRPGNARAGLLTVWVGVCYFLVWTLLGVAVFPAGAALAALEMHWPALSRAVPGAAGAVILAAGILQFSAWKARHLACCCGRSTRKAGGASCVVSAGARLPASVAAATRYGMRQGLHCVYSCAGATAVLLVAGVMDVRVMVVVTAAITAERLAPDGEQVARAVGVMAIGIGMLMLVRAAITVVIGPT